MPPIKADSTRVVLVSTLASHPRRPTGAISLLLTRFVPAQGCLEPCLVESGYCDARMMSRALTTKLAAVRAEPGSLRAALHTLFGMQGSKGAICSLDDQGSERQAADLALPDAACAHAGSSWT